MSYAYLKFLNLNWWYCQIYSLFGGKCTYVDEFGNIIPDGGLGGSVPVATSTPTGTVDFWQWLFGGGASSGNEYSGAFAGLINAFAPLIALIAGILGFLWGVYSALAYMLSGLLILLILGSAIGLAMIRYQELSVYGTLSRGTAVASGLRSRWQLLLDQAISTDPKGWRTAILEADIMLGELLLKLSYQGDSTAERLRAVPEDAFVTLPNAWEAHRIRNFVSARSSNYILTQREAFRVMKLYEQVFEEFDFI